jgi:hypothetical protein
MSRLTTTLLAATLLGAMPAWAKQTPPDDGPVTAFTGNDLFKLEAARDPRISPDGR